MRFNATSEEANIGHVVKLELIGQPKTSLIEPDEGEASVVARNPAVQAVRAAASFSGMLIGG